MRVYDSDRRKILSLFAHAACLMSWAWVPLLVPLLILMASEDPVVKENAKESLNFQLNVIVYCILFAILSIIVIGYPGLIAMAIASFILPLVAIVNVARDPDRPYRYPLHLIFRFV